MRLFFDRLLFRWATSAIRRYAERIGCDCDVLPGFNKHARSDLLFTRHADGTDVFVRSYADKCCHRLSDTELRAYGWSGDLHGDLAQFRAAFVSHVKRVDAATQLTRSQPESQLNRAKRVLAAFDDAYRLLAEYGFANVKRGA